MYFRILQEETCELTDEKYLVNIKNDQESGKYK